MNSTGNYFVPLKDSKENFMIHPTTRPINPSKNEIGRISKHILDQKKTKLVSELNVNHWKNTISVIKWLKDINDKNDKRLSIIIIIIIIVVIIIIFAIVSFIHKNNKFC